MADFDFHIQKQCLALVSQRLTNFEKLLLKASENGVVVVHERPGQLRDLIRQEGRSLVAGRGLCTFPAAARLDLADRPALVQGVDARASVPEAVRRNLQLPQLQLDGCVA